MNTEELLKNHHLSVLEYNRKKRSDSGIKRNKYKSILPAKYKNYIYRSNRKQREFDLTIDEFNNLLSLPCVFCGTHSQMTVDRINSHEGYIKGNVQPCCYVCNIMKQLQENEAFVNQIKKIYTNLFKK